MEINSRIYIYAMMTDLMAIAGDNIRWCSTGETDLEFLLLLLPIMVQRLSSQYIVHRATSYRHTPSRTVPRVVPCLPSSLGKVLE